MPTSPPNRSTPPRVRAGRSAGTSTLELAKTRATELFVEKERPQALVLDFLLELADVTSHCVVWPAHCVRENPVQRLDFLVAELLDPVQLRLEFWVGREVPCDRSHIGTIVINISDSADQDVHDDRSSQRRPSELVVTIEPPAGGECSEELV